MSVKRIGRNDTLIYFLVFMFIQLIIQQGMPAKGWEKPSDKGPSFRVKKSAQSDNIRSREDFEQLLSEAKKLYNEMDYEAAIRKLTEAKGKASTAMQKAELNLYLSLAYYAMSEGKSTRDLEGAIENMIIFDYQSEPDENLCPPGYMEIYHKIKAGYGGIRVFSKPSDADVYINRSQNPVGKTNLALGVKAGKVRVKVKLGRKEKEDEHKVPAGQEITLPTYDFSKKFPMAIVLLGAAAVVGAVVLFALKGGDGKEEDTGSIQVNSTPSGGKIYLDGTDTGKVTNTTLTGISPGSHTIKLAKDGYSDKEQSVSVTGGQTAAVNLTLTKDTITISEPKAGATWIKGSSIEIKWQVSAGSDVQSEPAIAASFGAGVQNQFRFNAQYQRRSRYIAGHNRTNSDDFIAAEGKSLSRRKEMGEPPIIQSHSEVPAPGYLQSSSGGASHFPSKPAVSPRLGQQTRNSAKVLAIAKVKIELYKGTASAETISPETDNDGSFTWTVSNSLTSSSEYKVRVSCSSDTGVFAESGLITIASQGETITVTQPAADTTWNKGKDYFIKWTSELTGNVKIDLYKGSSSILTIKTSTKNDGKEPWTVPTDLDDGSDYNILISSVDVSGLSGRSGNFTLTHWYKYETQWQVNRPCGVAVDASGNIYVTEYNNNQILKLKSGVETWARGKLGTGDEEFNHPIGITVDASGNLYVTDAGNHRVQKWDTDGDFKGWWGKDDLGSSGWHDAGSGRTSGFSGNQPREFQWPDGIAVDSSGYIYVADGENNRIQKFKDNEDPLIWGSQGTGQAQFQTPREIAIDTDQNIYVADFMNHRIQKFDSSGNPVAPSSWGSQGSEDGQFKRPIGIATDSYGHVFVADYDNHRIQEFAPDGSFILKWGTPGNSNGFFYHPHEVAVDSSGHVYVADEDNNRIQKFQRVG